MELLIATKNQGKLEEIKKLFYQSAVPVTLYFLPDFGITADCDETGKTFTGNATIKSLFYGEFVKGRGIYVVGDDSGLAVDALDGAPGIYSSRYSGPGATDETNMAKLLQGLQNEKNRSAKFITAASLSLEGNVIRTFTGEVEGVIIDDRRGDGGFGYDPIFFYPPYEKTFAQLSTEEKNRISHRARAFQKIKNYLENLQGKPF